MTELTQRCHPEQREGPMQSADSGKKPLPSNFVPCCCISPHPPMPFIPPHCGISPPPYESLVLFPQLSVLPKWNHYVIEVIHCVVFKMFIGTPRAFWAALWMRCGTCISTGRGRLW